MPAPKATRVRLRWQPGRTDAAGRGYAVLRWTEVGIRKQEALGYLDPDAAEQMRGDREAAIRLGVSLPSGDASSTVADLVAHYLRTIEEEQRGTARYRRHEMLHGVRIARHLGRVLASQVAETHIRRLVAACQSEENAIPEDATPQQRQHALRGARRKSSLLDMLGCLRRVFRVARDEGLIDREPPTVPKNMLTDDRRAPRQLTEQEVGALIAAGASAVGPWFGTLLQFLAWCPRRPVAIFALTRADCAKAETPHVRRREIKINIRRDKAGRGRGPCPLTEPALAALRIRLAEMGDAPPGALVWTSATGRPLSAPLLAPQLARAAKAAGLSDVNVYDFRKFGASMVYAKAGGNLRVTAEYTGHEDIHTLLARYVSAPKGAADELAERVTWTPAPLRMVEEDEGDE